MNWEEVEKGSGDLGMIIVRPWWYGSVLEDAKKTLRDVGVNEKLLKVRVRRSLQRKQASYMREKRKAVRRSGRSGFGDRI